MTERSKNMSVGQRQRAGVSQEVSARLVRSLEIHVQVDAQVAARRGDYDGVRDVYLGHGKFLERHPEALAFAVPKMKSASQ